MGRSLIKFNFFFYHRRFFLWFLFLFLFRFFWLRIVRFDVYFIQQFDNLLVVSESFSSDVNFLLSLNYLLKIGGVLLCLWRTQWLWDLSWWRHKSLLFRWDLVLFFSCESILLGMPILSLNRRFISHCLLWSLILLKFKVVLRLPVLHLSMSYQFLYLWFLIFRLKGAHTEWFTRSIWSIVNTSKW